MSSFISVCLTRFSLDEIQRGSSDVISVIVIARRDESRCTRDFDKVFVSPVSLPRTSIPVIGSRFALSRRNRIFLRALRARPSSPTCPRAHSSQVESGNDGHIRVCRKSKRAVLEENDQKESRRRRSAPPVVVTQVIRQDYDQIPEQRVVQKEQKAPEAENARRKAMEHPLNSRLSPKVTPITDDYEISNHVLGLGINGKVVQCYDRNTRQKYALKVSRQLYLRSLAV